MRGGCVVTLPIETVDKRAVSVIVESIGDTYTVHDGGKTLSELFCHGVSMTESRLEHQSDIAESHGVHLKNKMLRIVCKQPDLENAILAVAQCSSMSMLELVTHKPKFEEDSLSSKVLSALELWKPAWVTINRGVEIKALEFEYKLNAVCYAGAGAVVVKVLGQDSARDEAQQYAFLGKDLDQTAEYSNWLRLAVIPNAQRWNEAALKLVRRYSIKTVEVRDRNEDDCIAQIPVVMDQLIPRTGGAPALVQ
jgi:hypothetical protein